ncbi:MAG TPA: hypothetical protein VHI13_06555 [Candidatus Kapabacteria bacterium]|nr:hypothetical protein [Candidatus Kapabacteria bacterium]
MNNNHTDPAASFPELDNSYAALYRIAEAFVAPEYATAGFGLLRALLADPTVNPGLGRSTVITTPHEYNNIVVTAAQWWLINFHIAESESLEEGDAVEEIGPDDFEEVLEEDAEHGEETAESAAGAEAEESDEDDDGDSELVEATFYQVGTFLLDSTVIPAESIFDREDLDCYAYDYPEERIAGERFYWARLVWEPEDLANEDLVNAIRSSLAYILENYPADTPFAEYHDLDFARLVADPALCDRLIAAADFGDVIVIGGDEDDDN